MPSIEPTLFDMDDLPGEPVDRSMTIRPTAERPLSKEERAFNRAVAKVQTLRVRLDEETTRLERALAFHAAELRPRVEQALTLRTALVRRLAPFLDDRRLKSAQKKALCAMLTEQLDEVLSQDSAPDTDLQGLFERLQGIGYAEALQGDIDEARRGMAAMFEELGVDVEVPDLRADMSDEEVARAAAELADEMRRAEADRTEEQPPRTTTKRELREAERARQFEQLRKDHIGAIYKRLVKALHPDLEADPVAREKKSRLMQEVTTAYSRGDLHALLRLELVWIEGAGLDAVRLGTEKLQAYTALMKQQAAELEAECNSLRFHPRYAPLLVEGPFGVPMLIEPSREAAELDALIASLRLDVERLGSDDALRLVREMLRVYRDLRR